MPEGIVQFEVEVTDLTQMKSRVSWPGSRGPWIEGGLEDLMVHFTYAGWTAYMLGYAMSLVLASQDNGLGQTVTDMLTKTMEAMGAVEMAEIRMTRDAMEQVKKDRIDP
jgi:hypothetical protein